MKIKILKDTAVYHMDGICRDVKAGDVVDVPETEAQTLFRFGHAEAVEESPKSKVQSPKSEAGEEKKKK